MDYETRCCLGLGMWDPLGVFRELLSTTADQELLALARKLSGQPDDVLIDRALAAFIDRLQTTNERRALAEMPYEDDPDLVMGHAPAMPDLPYDGEVPLHVRHLAARRRQA